MTQTVEGFLVVNTRTGELKVAKRQPQVSGHQVYFSLTIELPDVQEEVGHLTLTVPDPPEPTVDIEVFTVPGLEVSDDDE